ncbi:MAG: MarR family transcriptional regulator [Candidatus Bipolaricaulota bacterium]
MTPRDEALGHLLAQACKLLRDRMHARMEEIGLHRGQGFILFRLGDQDGIVQTELAHQAMVRPATLTPALQRMERAGLIERRPDPRDQRVSRVYLTDKGKAVRLRTKGIWQDLERELRVAFDAEEQIRLRDALLRIRDLLGSAGAQGTAGSQRRRGRGDKRR